MRATILVSSSDRAKRLAAAAELANSNQSAVASLLQERLAPDGETDAEVRVALQQALSSVRDRLAWGERLAVVFTGISLGSVLLLVALGLAITYGLMGVINMVLDESQCRSEGLPVVSAGPGRARGRGTEARVGQGRTVSRFVTPRHAQSPDSNCRVKHE